MYIPVVPARGGAEVALGIYFTTFLIYRTSMRRAPARPVRACFVRSCCTDVVQEHDLRATPVPGNTKRRRSAHFTLHSSHFTLHTSHLHFALHTSSHLKACELFSPHLSSSHLIPSLLTCHQSKFNCFHLIRSPINLSHLLELFSTHLSCSARQQALTVRGKSLAQKKHWAQKVFLHTNTWDTNVFRQKSLSEILCTTKLAQSTSQYYFVVQSLHKARPSTTSCTTKLAQSISQYFCVLQSLHKALPSTTLYYKACTKHFPVLLCTTKFAQTTSQYYFVLQSLHKAFPSTTLYYKACTKCFPVLLCTTKLAQGTSQVLLCTTKLAQTTPQYYFVLQSLHRVFPSTTLYYNTCTQTASQYYCVLQSLHKVLPSTTLFYKACTKHFLVLLCTTKLAQNTSQYIPVLLCTTKLARSTSQYYFGLQSLHKVRPSTTLWYKACTNPKKDFTHSKFFRREAFTHSKLFKQRSFYTQKLLQTTSFYTEKLLHTASFHTQQAFTHRTLTHCAFTHGKRLHTQQAF